MDDDIVERLRERACPAGLPHTGDNPTDDHGHTDCWLHHQAADEIERLRTDVAATEAEVEDARQLAEEWKAEADRAWNRHLESLGRAHDLQALIDAWATARARVTIDQGWDALVVTEDALLAAARPEENAK